MPLKRESCRDWKLYVITDPNLPKGRNLEDVVRQAVEAGASVVQLRDKTASDEELTRLAKRLLSIMRPKGVPLIVNDRLEVAHASDADGLHLGQEDGPIQAVRKILGKDKIVGRSTHSPEQALGAQKEGADYIGVGPVFATPTKPGRKPVDLDLVRFAAKNVTIPFVAIGGIDLGNALEVRQAGASTIAVVRAVMQAPDAGQATASFLGLMKQRIK